MSIIVSKVYDSHFEKLISTTEDFVLLVNHIKKNYSNNDTILLDLLKRINKGFRNQAENLSEGRNEMY
jgi:hypothetical protein